jgi:RNA polymerase sigma-70 factor (ECF subfamily)
LRRHRAALARLSADGASPSGEEEAIARMDAQRALAAALREIALLPQDQRDAVNLVLWSGLSYQEAAEALGVPIGTVRSRIGRARGALEGALAPLTTTTKESL